MMFVLPQFQFTLGSLHFIFNQNNALGFLNKIKILNKENKVEIELQNIENKQEVLVQICLVENDDFIFYKNNIIKLWISEDMREYFEYKFTDFLSKGNFCPAEAGSFQRTNSSMLFTKKKIVELYFLKKV